MQRIRHTTAAATLPDYSSTGNPGFFREGAAGGDAPTFVSADWCNAVQEEIVEVIDHAGIELDHTDSTQLRQAIIALIDARLALLAVFPVGSIMMRAVNGATSGWLMCDGAEYSRTAYPVLYAAIGEEFGAGDGLTTFNVPDLRSRFPRCHDARTGRAFGTSQAAGVKLPALTASIAQSGEHTETFTTTSVTLTHSNATSAAGGAVDAQTLTAQASSHMHTFTTSAAGVMRYQGYDGVTISGWIGAMGTNITNPSAVTAKAENHSHTGTTEAENQHTHMVSVPAIPAHTHPVSVPSHAPHNHSVTVSIPAHGHSVTVTAADDDETRPANVTVAFMIRAI